MSDLDHLDPRLDRAFEALTRELALERGPGAAAAVSTARRRRRARVGALALTALVVVGGGLAMPGLLSSEDGVAAQGGSARLDAAALGRATEGWTSGWEMWEEFSPHGGGSFGAASCSSAGSSDGDVGPTSTSRGTSRFVGEQRASAVLVLEQYADTASAVAAQDLSNPRPDACGTTTTYDVDGVQVRHDSMPPEDSGAWLGDIWSAQLGTGRAHLEIITQVGVADDATAGLVAEALVAGLRDGWTQSGMEAVAPLPDDYDQLPDFGASDLTEALAGWESASRVSASDVPNTPCLSEQVGSGSVVGSGGGTPRGLTWALAGFADTTTGPTQVAAMLDELRTCTDPRMAVEELPNGVTVVTYDTGGSDGRGALWLAANGDRAGVIGVDSADRPMPIGVREAVADALDTYLQLPWQ